MVGDTLCCLAIIQFMHLIRVYFWTYLVFEDALVLWKGIKLHFKFGLFNDKKNSLKQLTLIAVHGLKFREGLFSGRFGVCYIGNITK